jgi:hypothetical protein
MAELREAKPPSQAQPFYQIEITSPFRKPEKAALLAKFSIFQIKV